MNSQALVQANILDTLAAVLGGKFTGEHVVPQGICGKTEKLYGIINSDVTRRLFTAVAVMQAELLKLKDSLDKNVQDSHSVLSLALKLQSKMEVFGSLFWHSVSEEYPAMAANNAIRLCHGWRLVAEPQKWLDIVLVPDKNLVINNLIKRIQSIASGQYVAIKAPELAAVDEDVEVIGTLTNERIRDFYSLRREVQSELRELTFESLRELREASLTKKNFEKAMRLELLVSYYEIALKIVDLLFFCGVRENIPVAANESAIGVRQGWKIVKPAVRTPLPIAIVHFKPKFDPSLN